MSNKIVKKETEFAGRKLILETGKFAPQANMAVTATYGDTTVLATVVSAGPNPDLDYFPLSVNYFENLYASGTIKSSRFIKREGRPTDEAIVMRRLVDHAIRPLFPQEEGFMDEVQVALNVLSFDEDADPVFLSMVAASAALHASDIPWAGPMSTVRVGYVNGEYVLNPSIKQLHEESDLDMMVSFVGDEKRFLGLEAEANILPEEVILGGLKHAQDNIDPVLNIIKDFAEELNPGNKKYEFESKLPDKEVTDTVSKLMKDRVIDLIEAGHTKEESVKIQRDLKEELYSTLEGKFKKVDIDKAFYSLEKEALRHLILEEGRRPDGRGTDDIRELSGEVGVLPRVHGSSVFTRGMTQILNIATLGAPSEEQLIQDMYGERTKRYIHFYTFPPFSTGEVGRMGFAGGREIGHGMLAEKALLPVIPDQKDFPYTIIVKSETLSSYGSSSMASACASSLALMDAGVPIKDVVAGIGVGLVTNEDFSKYKILTDLTGLEDGGGYLDFKMTGTKEGVTAIQVDIKAKGLSFDMLPDIFKKSHDARIKVLDFMSTVIESPRDKVNEFAPKSASTQIQPDQIGMVIGTGGKVIKGLQEETDTVVSIEETGAVTVSGTNEENVQKAIEIIEGMTKEVKPGEIFEGEVEELAAYGAFVEFLPGKTGLLHISEIKEGFVQNVEEHLSVGQKVKVIVLEVSRDGKYALSMKEVDNPDAVKERKNRGDRDNRRNGGGRRDNRRGGSGGPRRGGGRSSRR